MRYSGYRVERTPYNHIRRRCPSQQQQQKQEQQIAETPSSSGEACLFPELKVFGSQGSLRNSAVQTQVTGLPLDVQRVQNNQPSWCHCVLMIAEGVSQNTDQGIQHSQRQTQLGEPPTDWATGHGHNAHFTLYYPVYGSRLL